MFQSLKPGWNDIPEVIFKKINTWLMKYMSLIIYD